VLVFGLPLFNIHNLFNRGFSAVVNEGIAMHQIRLRLMAKVQISLLKMEIL
jgi:hypothetical protein